MQGVGGHNWQIYGACIIFIFKIVAGKAAAYLQDLVPPMVNDKTGLTNPAT